MFLTFPSQFFHFPNFTWLLLGAAALKSYAIEKLKNDDKGCLLDVRSEEEFEESHIPNAKLLNIRNPQSFIDGLEKMDKSLNYYVYCHSGVRSVQACQIMKTFGYENLFNLLGGISEWTGEKNNS